MDTVTVSFDLALFITAWIIGFIAASRISQFPLIVFVSAFIFAGASARYENQLFVDELIRYMLLFGAGIQGLWCFVGHTFCSKLSAQNVGWKGNQFQYEVGMANLAISVLGTVAFWNSLFWIPTIVVVSIFYLGAAVIHIRDKLLHNNAAPGNTGWILYTDILIPAILIMSIIYKIEHFGFGAGI